MTCSKTEKSMAGAEKPAPTNKGDASQSDRRKKRLAEQLRMNLHNRKAQMRLRRNSAKPDDK